MQHLKVRMRVGVERIVGIKRAAKEKLVGCG